MQISPGVTDLAERVQVLLASLPDPASAMRFLDRLRQESPGGFERIASSPRGPALRAPHFFLQQLPLGSVLEKSRGAVGGVAAGKSGTALQQGRLSAAVDASVGAGVPAALDLAGFRRRAVAAHRAARRAGRGRALRNYRGAFESRRRHPRRGLPAHPRRISPRGMASRGWPMGGPAVFR